MITTVKAIKKNKVGGKTSINSCLSIFSIFCMTIPSQDYSPSDSPAPLVNGHLVSAMGLNELPDVVLQHRVTHAKVTAGIEQLFVQKKAIGTVQVASRPGGLGQHVDSRG